ncbi:hypothetical protein [Arenibacter sp. F20364]|uniref:TapB family protein n=1 Tax=Arenibacter sp. F20364 TaxID=2926415 RepID=UPI001FF537D7|nr:hypothetical protein [Arenibacter sp. F20364]MCK0191616.1 hypothetical protein [Arenibacter sp. F20364]
MNYLKNTLRTLVILLVLNLPGASFAQLCDTFFPMREGVRMEYTLHDKKGKVEGSQWQEFRNVQKTANGAEAEIHMGFIDNKGKNPYEMSYNITCDGDVIRIDFKSLLSTQMMEQYGEMEAEITGTDIEWPTQLKPGMELPDAGMTMTMSMGAMNMKTEVEMTNRKVEKKETITVPAGTFDCYVIYSDNRSKMMMIDKNYPNRSWISEGVGTVKTESYNEKGKLLNSMVLSAISE